MRSKLKAALPSADHEIRSLGWCTSKLSSDGLWNTWIRFVWVCVSVGHQWSLFCHVMSPKLYAEWRSDRDLNYAQPVLFVW